MDREAELEVLYDGLAVFARRSREVGAELHPGLTLVAYTVMSYVEARPDARMVDLAAEWGLDRSTLSRQVNSLVSEGLLNQRTASGGRRGQTLELTPAGRSALDGAALSIRVSLVRKLADWTEVDIARFADLIDRFNRAVG